MRSRSSSQPPCSARSTRSRVTTLRERSRGRVSFWNSYSTPVFRDRRWEVVWSGARDMQTIVARVLNPRQDRSADSSANPLRPRHVVEGGDDLGRQLAVLDAQRAAELRRR